MENILICTAFITIKGRRIYAKDVGKKAFCFEVTPEQHKEYLEKKKKKQQNKEKNSDTELKE